MVRAKKHLGQHFLKDEHIAMQIVQGLTAHTGYHHLLEIGPGTGVLTKYILQNQQWDFCAMDLDEESVAYLKKEYPKHQNDFLFEDFLKVDLNTRFTQDFGIIGNFPYNISSQIFFKVLEYKNQIPEVVGMLQKEVAQRLSSPHGKKTYGILSVLLQVWYDIDYLFEVPPEVFIPPPKVHSAVIRLRRNERTDLGCSEKLFKQVVKAAFGLRRKKLRNALKQFNLEASAWENEVFDLRAEQLSVPEFIELTIKMEQWMQ